MYNNPNPIKIENPEQIKQACAGQLKLRGRPCLVIPSVTVDENLRVKPSDKTIKQCLEAMAGSGLFYRWSTGLGGLDRLVKIDSKGIPQWLAEWQRFRDEIQNFFILVNFAPDGTLVQRLYLTGFRDHGVRRRRDSRQAPPAPHQQRPRCSSHKVRGASQACGGCK
jgi:hypothetical protein